MAQKRGQLLVNSQEGTETLKERNPANSLMTECESGPTPVESLDGTTALAHTSLTVRGCELNIPARLCSDP